MASFSLWSRLNSPAHAHLLGLCGAGMKALAEFLVDRGWNVSGCDGDPDRLIAKRLLQNGISVATGHSVDHLEPAPDLLIYSAAVPSENPERQRARELKIPELSYVDVLAILTRESRSVAIAGTHGKSSTTTMLGQILQLAGRSASLICGAESLKSGRSGWAGDGSELIVEACEFRQHFLKLSPQIACLLGIEPDHFDCYPHLEDAELAYEKFLLKTCASTSSTSSMKEKLIVRADCLSTQRILKRNGLAATTFSLTDPEADWQAILLSNPKDRPVFQLQHLGEKSPEVTLAVPGLHNVQNSLAAAACGKILGLSLQQIANGLNEFQGLRRRFERRPDWRGMVVIDDYAHHPTEIRATLTAARQAYPEKRLICLFQSHQLSRTAALLDDFADALSLADRVYLLPIYAARENPGEGHESLARELLNRVKVSGGMIPALDRVWGTVQTDAGTDAVLLTLGAGNLSRIHYEDSQ